MRNGTPTLAPAGPVTYTCVIDGCDWTLTDESVLPAQPVRGETSRREALIADHLTSHDLVQYVATIDRLRGDLHTVRAPNA